MNLYHQLYMCRASQIYHQLFCDEMDVTKHVHIVHDTIHAQETSSSHGGWRFTGYYSDNDR